MTQHDASSRAFEPQRARLTGLAYRMLGSLAEAEDVVQDAFLRVRDIDMREIAEPAAYLHTTVARLCLDRLKSARARREVYVGTWLPEPIVDERAWLADPTATAPDAALEQADDLSFALMLTLERLTPPERTAFLLHDVFGQDYSAVAQVLKRSEAACRKLTERARAQVHEGAPRFEVEPEQEKRLALAFLSAASSGDQDALTNVLAEDAILYTDGGGNRRAPLNPVFGAARIGRFFAGIARRADRATPEKVEFRRINQLPGFLATFAGGDVAVAAVEIRDGLIARVYVINNPDKLRHLRSSQRPAGPGES